jgi:hypothetical protein
MGRAIRIAFAVAAVVLAAAPAEAGGGRKVFLNGIDLANVEVPPQAFKSCTVTFDDDGDVHITAPGFEVKTTKLGEAGAARDAAAHPRKRYFVANTGTAAGKVQYDIAVYVNGKKARTILSGSEDTVVEITDALSVGKNAIKLVASKNLGKAGKRRSYSPEDVTEILIGEGDVAKGTVMLRKAVITYRRNASESAGFTDAFELTAK